MAPESIWPGMFQAEAGAGNTAITTTHASSLMCSIGSVYCLDVICHGQSTRSTTTSKGVCYRQKTSIMRPGMVIGIIVVLLVSLVHSSFGLAQTQQAKKAARVGLLLPGFPPTRPTPPSPEGEALYQGLREVGYTEGKNLIVERRYAEGK